MHQKIIRIKKIAPYLHRLNSDLYRICASLRPNPYHENQYANLVYEIKSQLDFIASALTDEHGRRFGGICQDGHIFKLLHLYEDSLQIPTKSIQKKMVLEILINVCSYIIVANGALEGGANRFTQTDYALDDTREFINFLVYCHEKNNNYREKNIWFDLNEIDNLVT